MGSFKVWGSNIFLGIDVKTIAQSFTDLEWSQITLTGGTNPSGAADNGGFDLKTCSFRWVVLEYTNASGAGLIEAWEHGKKI